MLLAGALLAGALVAAGVTTATAEPRTTARTSIEPVFRVASFNILGWRHTAKGGKNSAMDSGETRMDRTVGLLDRRRISVAGLQEMQPQQYARLQQLTGSTWGAYPADTLTRYAMHNSVIWRTAEWDVVQTNTIAIPYFNGELVPMPYVLLRNKTTHRLVWFANFHNAADGSGRGSQAKWRRQAKALQVSLANELWETGVPLILTGDMNEKSSYFCTMAGKAPMRSANGGTVGANACTPPAGARIDWIFGSKDIRFSGYTMLRNGIVQRTSDHPMFFADVEIPSRPRD
jgi:endonuclease/exonuclease/phosphatase family metal-dependent hydrolase